MNSVRGKVNQSFGMALTQYNSLGYLDDQGKLCSKSSRISGFGDVPPKVRIHNGAPKLKYRFISSQRLPYNILGT
jgi:hypothetical protein